MKLENSLTIRQNAPFCFRKITMLESSRDGLKGSTVG